MSSYTIDLLWTHMVVAGLEPVDDGDYAAKPA